MRSKTVRLIVFSAGATLLPVPLLFSQQTDPLAASAPQTQPNQPGRVQAPTTSLQDSSGAPSDTIQEMKDKMFLRKATEGGLAEVQLGKLASTKASSQDVKDFGQKIADERAKLNISMAEVADSIGMRLPKNLNKAGQAQYDKLSTLSGDAFDKEYLACIVKDHHENLRDFRMESASTTDPELKAAVDNGAKIIREHLVLASKLATENGVPLPTRGGKPAPLPSQPAPPPNQ